MPVNTAEVSDAKPSAKTIFSDKPLGVRVSPNNYFFALFLLTFFSGLLVYLEKETTGTIVFGFAWIIVPVLFLTDRVTFDGRRLTRTGVLPRLWAKLNKSKYRLKIADVEQVETRSTRTLKRGDNIVYSYRTAIHGSGLSFNLTSGGEGYRRMIHKILPLVHENALDNRSIEVRDFFRDPKEILMKAEFAKIPSAEVLENSLVRTKSARKKTRQAPALGDEKADYLHGLANELRLGGYLPQALEAFRRALFLKPRDARLIFDFARCLHSFAAAGKNKNLSRKVFAALRLAERRAGGDPEMLSRLGECFFQYGDWTGARRAFQKSVDAADENFRARKGLAEIALREGKIAYVIHHFSTASRLAETPALKRWTRGEADYFARLNGDSEYMEMEVSRVNLLESLERSKKTCLQIALVSFPAIFIGIFFEENVIAQIGWAVSSISLLVWVGIIVSLQIFSARIPLDFEVED